MLSIGNVEITRIEEVVLNEPTTLFADWNDTVLPAPR
jgi:hypothetical protein